MKDTPPAVDELYGRMLMRRSGPERLRMGCEMFDAAREMMRASLTAAGVTDPGEVRVQILLRTYRGDLDDDVLARVAERVRRF